ncbi:MAG: phosphoribosylamine--glycine ligase [Acidobacteria bacterium]|nr:phosphoribosylamine--glycine ligase [Acidobacteriota bacterium]
MKVLVVGGGGREHALAWKLTREHAVTDVLCAPGNPGIATIARNIPIDSHDIDALAGLAEAEHVGLTIVGPEVPLNAGLVDVFIRRGLRVFGPTRAAAQLECSKVFAKEFMARHGIPTARYRVCTSADDARAIVASGELGFPAVIKADGLAAGKGVVVAADAEEALLAIHNAMDERLFGEAGTRVVIEECMVGPEVSFFALCDGRRAMPILSAQDHKRVFDNDHGPNTGGMGAFAPSPLVDSTMQATIMREIVEPVVAGMRADGHEYRGFLYAGLMLTCDGPKVVEFNVRFGDPEAQVVLPAIQEDLVPRLVAAAEGDLVPGPLNVSDDKHVGVVMASRGYPGPVESGTPIQGLDSLPEDVLVFHSGTRSVEAGISRPVTAGGRVLTVVGKGPTFETAVGRAYEGVSRISFDGMQFRRDIGRKALAR